MLKITLKLPKVSFGQIKIYNNLTQNKNSILDVDSYKKTVFKLNRIIWLILTDKDVKSGTAIEESTVIESHISPNHLKFSSTSEFRKL